MGVRLARSEEPKVEPWHTVRALCEGCGNMEDLEVLDERHAFCTVCKTTNTLVMIHMDDGSYVAATRKEP
jgi:formate dehydrogenase maturation protein FdhE